ncbi:hypothetical protein B0H19DRAFT_1224039 [Mycena capillaripes]|nr:hypothetical protein B0H19DRAFT_1224039 [Mycena capillaripes]
MAGTPPSHFLSLLKPKLREWSNRTIFRPYSKLLGLSPTEVVGMWLTGSKYDDLVNMLGVSAAGYVPQLFSLVYSNVDVVWDLLSASNAKALILDVAFSSLSGTSPVPTLPALAFPDFDTRVQVLSDVMATDVNDVALIFHSSGTTSGVPKLIRSTHGWIMTYMKYKYSLCQGPLDGSDVANTLGSLAHVGSVTSSVLYASSFLLSYRVFCTAQSPAMAMSTEELMSMIRFCGLNRMAVYATFLSVYIKAAQKDQEVLLALRAFRQIVHTGVALNRQDEKWAYTHRIPITTLYATSETASVMTTVLGSAPEDRLLRLLPGVSARFIPYSLPDDPNPSTASQLWELIIPSGAPDSPHLSLFSSDQLYHTGDLFEEVTPGLYRFRGRQGDMLKTLYGFCDTKAIEDNVRKACEGLIHDVVVLGTNRPKIVLFVEVPAQEPVTEETKNQLALEIIHRTKSFNDRLFRHEKVEEPAQILILPKGALPRTKEKGNIRRNATEELFAGELDAMCGNRMN